MRCLETSGCARPISAVEGHLIAHLARPASDATGRGTCWTRGGPHHWKRACAARSAASSRRCWRRSWRRRWPRALRAAQDRGGRACGGGSRAPQWGACGRLCALYGPSPRATRAPGDGQLRRGQCGGAARAPGTARAGAPRIDVAAHPERRHALAVMAGDVWTTSGHFRASALLSLRRQWLRATMRVLPHVLRGRAQPLRRETYLYDRLLGNFGGAPSRAGVCKRGARQHPSEPGSRRACLGCCAPRTAWRLVRCQMRAWATSKRPRRARLRAAAAR
jgi:hypothetical protein